MTFNVRKGQRMFDIRKTSCPEDKDDNKKKNNMMYFDNKKKIRQSNVNNSKDKISLYQI